MGFSESKFKVIEDNNCPFYTVGDEFKLAGKAVFLDRKPEKAFVTTAVIKVPEDKSPCRILISDITSILIEFGGMDNVPKYVTNCGGCSGSIRIAYRNDKEDKQPETEIPSDHDIKAEKHIAKIAKLLSNFSIFETLAEAKIRKLVPMLRLVKFEKGDYIVKKGEPGKNFHIIVSGNVEVRDGDMAIAALGKGEVFGEMSLLSGNPVGASIQVSEPSVILGIKGKNFRRVLDQFPSLQMYLTRLLAQRLAKTNVERAEELSSGMIGKLSEIAPSELFQTLNVNQKTGVLNMRLSKGPAFLAFREGLLVRAEYDKQDDKEAFFEMLREKEGRFKFVPGLKEDDLKADVIGDFMWLLMEGLNRIDEDGETTP